MKSISDQSSTAGALNLSRRQLKELNLSLNKSEKVKIPSIDVGEILKQSRRTITKTRNTTFVKDESIKVGVRLTKNKSVSKNESVKANSTFTIERDFVTPDNDTPAMEIKRKLIENELDQSVTMRRPRKFKNLGGTPVAGETSTTQTPISIVPHPRKIIGMGKELQTAPDESESTVTLQSVAYRITFDDLHSDDQIDSDSDKELPDIYPKWSKSALQLGRLQYLVDPDVIDTLFNQDIKIEPTELFPHTSPKKLKRRRSSIMWKD